MLRKLAVPTFLLAFAVYIFLPTPDQLFIFPAGGLFLAYALHISIVNAVLMVTLFYYGSGAVSLLFALIIGGKPIYQNLLLLMTRKRKVQPLLKRVSSA